MIGYLRKGPDGLEGEHGLAYDYILAHNGVFLEAQNALFTARIRVGLAQVRGLKPLSERVKLVHGPVPSYFLAMVLRLMREDHTREVYAAVVWDPSTGSGGQYALRQPRQEGTAAHVRYDVLPNTVLDFHSHGLMPAQFSHVDDMDDQGFRISVVIGKLQERQAEMAMRVGVYGYHAQVRYPEVFSGPVPADLDVAVR
jgi:PRTRC genetic system protein A